MDAMTIGRLARAAGVHVESIRYYQRRGLLQVPRRPAAGVRRYGDDALSRLRFIKRAQDVGFSLREVADLLKLQRGCREARSLAAAKLAAVERRMANLSRIREVLGDLIGRCDTSGAGSCPIIESLSGEERQRILESPPV